LVPDYSISSVLLTKPRPSTSFVDYKNIARTIQPGHTIFIDDGTLEFKVTAVLDSNAIKARTQAGGTLRSRRGVNLPNTNVDLPFLDEKDRSDLRFGIRNNVDMIFASFVRSAEDIDDIREELGTEGRQVEIIAKIEDRRGLVACHDIIKAADGIMVARGDLGVLLPHSEVTRYLIGPCKQCLE
jgi:pyruvate kinase